MIHTILEVLATMWRRSVIAMVLCGAMLASSVVLAQQKPAPVGNAPAPAGSGQPKNATVQQVSADNYYFEWALVFVMTGAALFAVCRSSRRNA